MKHFIEMTSIKILVEFTDYFCHCKNNYKGENILLLGKYKIL